MRQDLPAPSRATARVPRALAVWLGVTTAAGGAAVHALPGARATLRVVTGSGSWQRVDVALGDICALALVTALAWAWAVTSVTVVQLLRGSAPAYGGATRRLVLAACGAVLVAAGPAVAETDASSTGLHGLPYPDRPVAAQSEGAPQRDQPEPRPGARTVVVAPGESLWTIAVRTAPSTRSVAAHWRAIIAANPGLPDPDVVLPGQRIEVPPPAGAR